MRNWAEQHVGKADQACASSDPEFDGGSAPPPSNVERLFREHNEALLHFLRARLRSDADAREAAQEAYVRLLQLDQSNQPSFLRAYLFKIAGNVATDMLRHKKVRTRFDSVDEEALSPGRAAQEEALSARQQLELVQKALNELPPRCREAFLLRRQHNLATGEISERLGVSDRMIRNYLARAIEHVQQALAQQISRG